MLEAVGMAEINKIFAVTDALGVHRDVFGGALAPGHQPLRLISVPTP